MLTSSTPLLSLVLLALSYTTHADTDSKPLAPCNIISPRTGAQFDLSPMAVKPLPDGSFKKHDRNKSYHARGYDYGANFTMNFCAPVVENFTRVVGVDEGLWGNISAYYEREGRAFSLGQMSTQPVFRGRKLVMNYTGGSPCGADAEDEDNWYERRGVGERSQDEDDEDRDGSDEDDRSSRRKSKKPVQRKNAIFSFLCDQEPVDSSKPKVQVSFVSWSPDECTYVFEARSRHSCGGLAKQPKSVGAGGVFSLMWVALLGRVMKLY
jgi:cation-dependent mannose-6-phosphate receptor